MLFIIIVIIVIIVSFLWLLLVVSILISCFLSICHCMVLSNFSLVPAMSSRQCQTQAGPEPEALHQLPWRVLIRRFRSAEGQHVKTLPARTAKHSAKWVTETCLLIERATAAAGQADVAMAAVSVCVCVFAVVL